MENTFVIRSKQFLALVVVWATFSVDILAEEPSALEDAEVLQGLLGVFNSGSTSEESSNNQSEGGESEQLLLQGLLDAFEEEGGAALAVEEEEPKLVAEPLPEEQQEPEIYFDAEGDAEVDQAVLNQLFGVLEKRAAEDDLSSQGDVVEPRGYGALDDASILGGLLNDMEDDQKTDALFGEADVLGSLLDLGGSEDLEAEGYFNDMDLVGSMLDFVSEDRENDIFESEPQSYDFTDEVIERQGKYGFTALYQSSPTYSDGLLITANAQHMLGESLYGLIEAQVSLSPLSNPNIRDGSGKVILGKNAYYYSLVAGVGYPLFRGMAISDENTYLPWQISVKGLMGQQFTGSSQGLYLGTGLAIEFLKDNYWYGLESRYFYVDDESLNKVGAFRGLQIGGSIGFYY